MKLKAEIPYYKNWLVTNSEKIKNYAARLKEKGGYKNFTVRFCWDCITACYGIPRLCSLYDKYSCNDRHIETLAIKCVQEIFPELLQEGGK